MTLRLSKPTVAEVRRRNALRKQATETVVDATLLTLKISPIRSRELIRQLNDTIGMFAYEVIGYDSIGGDMLMAEYCVPGKELALFLKLEHNGL